MPKLNGIVPAYPRMGSRCASTLKAAWRRDDSLAKMARSAPSKEGPRMDRQPRITDLVPRRYRVFALWFVLGAAAVAGLETLYFHMPRLAAHTSDGRIAAFDLDGEGSLGAWFSSMTLGSAGLLSLIILSIRRHTADDYHGRYRVWFWGALLFFAMSIDEAGSLHEGFKEMMSGLTGMRLAGDGSLWWVLAYLLVGGVIGVRIVLDVRRCRAAITCLLLTAACYVAAVVVQLEWVFPERGALGVMLEEGLEMGGNLILLLGLGLYARYAILESQGELTAAAKETSKPRRAKEPAEPVAAAKPRLVEAVRAATGPLGAHVRQSQTSGSTAATPAAQSAKPASTPTGQAGVRVDRPQGHQPHQRLSKSERRALRRQQQADRYSGHDDE